MIKLKSTIAMEAVAEQEELTTETEEETTAAGEPVSNQDGEIEGGVGETAETEEAEADGEEAEEVQAEVVADDEDQVQEEAAEGQDVAEEVAETVEEARVEGETVETELAADEQEEAQVQEIANEAMVALEAAIALESAAEALGAQMYNGTISRESSVYLMQNVNKALGTIQQPAISSMGLEAAEEPDEKVGVASQVMGTLTEYASRIKAAIIEGLKKAVEIITTRLKNIFTAAGRVKSRAEKLKEALKAKDVQLQAVTSPRIAAGVMVVDNVSKNLVSDLGAVFTIAHAFTKPAIYAPLEKIANGADLDAMNKELDGLRNSWSSALGDTIKDNTEVRLKALTLGNTRYTLNIPESVEQINALSARAQKEEGAKTIDTPMRELKLDEAVRVADLVIKGLTQLEALRNDPAFKAVEKSVMANINKATDKVQDPGAFRKVLNVLLRLVSGSVALPSTVFAGAAVRQSSHALDWVQASIVTPTAGERLSNAGTAISGAAKSAGSKVSSAAKSAGSKVSSAAKSAGDKVSSAAKTAGDKVSSAAKTAGGKIAGAASAVKAKVTPSKK